MVHMSPRVLLLSGVLAFAATSGNAWGQIPYDPCNICAQPVVQVQSCYQTVPVTEYRQVKQTVQKPVVETTYVDQPVTEYHPVTENKTATVPTVAYQNVTECQPVTRDMGRWVTTYQQRQQQTPCEYDQRPGLLGAMNRAGYSMRMAFTPKVTTQRQYCPNVVTQMVPVTRQVAIQGSRTVNYQVTRMVPVTTTRKMAVNTVRMISQDVVTQQAVTVMRTVPVGTASFAPTYGATSATAFVPTYAIPSATAFSSAPTPVPDPVSAASKPVAPKADRSAKLPPPLNEDGDVFNDNREGTLTPIPKRGTTIKKSSYSVPQEAAPVDDGVTSESVAQETQVAASSRTPSAARVGGWVVRRTSRPVEQSGPAFPDTIVAGIERSKR